MNKKLNWKKGLLSDTYRIYSNYQQIGELRNSMFSQTAIGEINGKEYTFKTKGFFTQYTEIYDNAENSVIGEITYGSWMNKAFISIRNKDINWKYDNMWNTKWSLKDSKGTQINYAGSSTGGKIDSNVDDDLLLLTGLYVTNYYWQMTLIIVMVFMLFIWA